MCYYFKWRLMSNSNPPICTELCALNLYRENCCFDGMYTLLTLPAEDYESYDSVSAKCGTATVNN